MVQLASGQVTQISEGGKVNIALRGDEQVYADLQAQNKGSHTVFCQGSFTPAAAAAGYGCSQEALQGSASVHSEPNKGTRARARRK